MGTGEENTPSKTKPAPSTQEIPPAPSYPDWSGSLQAYYAPGGTPPPFFTSTVASPTPHPYMWGGQPLIPPYGTPVPYPAIYPPGGVYGHPNMPPATHMAMPPNLEPEGKGQDGKDRSSAKKSKANSGNAGMAGAKAGESGKATSGSGNDGASQSAESGSDGSSDASDENQQDISANKKGSFDQMLADVPGKPVGSMPATNLNIGMDLWNASGATAGTKLRPNPSATSSSAAAGTLGDQWIQPDERELKRQKRKQSNRESARRSRLRKQAECEELQVRVENLNTDNRTLREELQKLSEECEKLTSENSTIKEELTRLCGPEVVANLDHRARNVDGKS